MCQECVKTENSARLVEVGVKALMNIPADERKKICSDAGKKSAAQYDPVTNKGRFSKERWDLKTEEEKHAHAMRGVQGLKKKLEDPVWAAQHFAKIFEQTKIGFVSKGHKDLHGLIEQYGFKSHVQISNMQVDECNEELKIVIEYNGDMWHCNPKNWKADDYNTAIRMTAGEKWEKDIARHRMLRKMGYTTIIVWESGWIENAQKYLDKIIELCYNLQQIKQKGNEHENGEPESNPN